MNNFDINFASCWLSRSTPNIGPVYLTIAVCLPARTEAKTIGIQFSTTSNATKRRMLLLQKPLSIDFCSKSLRLCAHTKTIFKPSPYWYSTMASLGSSASTLQYILGNRILTMQRHKPPPNSHIRPLRLRKIHNSYPPLQRPP